MFIKSSCASDFLMLKIYFALKTSVSVGWLKIEASQKKNFDPFLAGKARAMKYFHDPFYNC